VRSRPPLSWDILQGSDEAKHPDSAEQNYAAHPQCENHTVIINKLVNSTPPITSAIQTRLFELKDSHSVQPFDENTINSTPLSNRPAIQKR
jgi:hypothetical protein